MSAAPFAISQDFVAAHNARLEAATVEDYQALSHALARRGIEAEALVGEIMRFAVAIPTWGVGAGGTRFARFPGPGEPRNVFEKIEDCGVIQQLARATPTISPHIPWDKTADYVALREAAAKRGLAFDAV
ncbi:MAG TPA: sugar isomerase, partial [Roseiarcus sp.]|nr:sugar isomerase [Roseiarcus sp.]